jgi:hypothetical protein
MSGAPEARLPAVAAPPRRLASALHEALRAEIEVWEGHDSDHPPSPVRREHAALRTGLQRCEEIEEAGLGVPAVGAQPLPLPLPLPQPPPQRPPPVPQAYQHPSVFQQRPTAPVDVEGEARPLARTGLSTLVRSHDSFARCAPAVRGAAPGPVSAPPDPEPQPRKRVRAMGAGGVMGWGAAAPTAAAPSAPRGLSSGFPGFPPAPAGFMWVLQPIGAPLAAGATAMPTAPPLGFDAHGRLLGGSVGGGGGPGSFPHHAAGAADTVTAVCGGAVGMPPPWAQTAGASPFPQFGSAGVPLGGGGGSGGGAACGVPGVSAARDFKNMKKDSVMAVLFLARYRDEVAPSPDVFGRLVTALADKGYLARCQDGDAALQAAGRLMVRVAVGGGRGCLTPFVGAPPPPPSPAPRPHHARGGRSTRMS